LQFAPILPQNYFSAPILPQKDHLIHIEKIKSLNYKIWQRNYYESIILSTGELQFAPILPQQDFSAPILPQNDFSAPILPQKDHLNRIFPMITLTPPHLNFPYIYLLALYRLIDLCPIQKWNANDCNSPKDLTNHER